MGAGGRARRTVKRTKVDWTRTIKVAYDYPLIRARHRGLSRPARPSFPTLSCMLSPSSFPPRPRRRPLPRRRRVWPRRRCPACPRRRGCGRCRMPVPAQGRLLCIYCKMVVHELHLLGRSLLSYLPFLPIPSAATAAAVCYYRLYALSPSVALSACFDTSFPSSSSHRSHTSITRIIPSFSPTPISFRTPPTTASQSPSPPYAPRFLAPLPCIHTRTVVAPAPAPASYSSLCTSTSLSSHLPVAAAAS